MRNSIIAAVLLAAAVVGYVKYNEPTRVDGSFEVNTISVPAKQSQPAAQKAAKPAAVPTAQTIQTPTSDEIITAEVDRMIAKCRDHVKSIYGYGRCSPNEALVSIIEKYDVERPYNPLMKVDCRELIMEDGTRGTACRTDVGRSRGFESYSMENLYKAAALDPMAAIQIAETSGTQEQRLTFLLHAAAISPTPEQATGSLLRAAKSFRYAANIYTKEIGDKDMRRLVQRIAFEEMAVERGNPIPRPQNHWEGLKLLHPERVEKARVVVDSVKSKYEAQILEQRLEAGFNA